MNNVLDIKNDKCTGCGGCSKICPVSAIKIIRNLDGFYNPQINEKCISCGLCIKVCYKNFKINNDNYSIENCNAYLSYSLDDKIRHRASSGGIGEEICRYGISHGYKICGVIYDYEKNIAKHVITEDINEVKKIVGSKYIQSYTEEAFLNLKDDEKYIIIGSPCQIYSLRKYIEYKNIKNWILIDFFCHGGPSLNLWEKYLDMIKRKENIKKIDYVNFRDKRIGWHKFSLTLKENDKIYSKTLDDDYFMNCFLKNLNLQNPCYNCELRFNKIYSDIRLGDFWGPKCIDDEKGSSIILTNTYIGENIFKNLENLYIEEITKEDLKISQYVEHLSIPKERKIFMDMLKTNKNLEEIYEEIVIPIKKKEKKILYIKKPIRLIKKYIKKFILR